MLLLAERHIARRRLSWEREWKFILGAPGTRGARLVSESQELMLVGCSVSEGV